MTHDTYHPIRLSYTDAGDPTQASYSPGKHFIGKIVSFPQPDVVIFVCPCHLLAELM